MFKTFFIKHSWIIKLNAITNDSWIMECTNMRFLDNNIAYLKGNYTYQNRVAQLTSTY